MTKSFCISHKKFRPCQRPSGFIFCIWETDGPDGGDESLVPAQPVRQDDLGGEAEGRLPAEVEDAGPEDEVSQAQRVLGGDDRALYQSPPRHQFAVWDILWIYKPLLAKICLNHVFDRFQNMKY